MSNIFNIKQELLSIFNELEENDGELTPELEESLNIKQEEFKDKIKSYTNVVKMLENDIVGIKAEKARLNDLQKSKEKTIERQLDTITSDDVLEYCNSKSHEEEVNGDEITTLSKEDIAQIKANVDLDIPVSELITTEHGMKLAKTLSEWSTFNCKAKISKTDIKSNAKENHTMPVFAKLVDNQTLTIK